MHAVMEKYVKSLQVGEGVHYGAMTLFPLSRSIDSPLRYRVLADALADGSVEVREKPAATVPELWLINHSDTIVLVMGGEEVVGGKQNRMVNASFLIAPHAELALPVTCLEHDRWHPTSDRFGAGEAVYSKLRRAANRQVRERLRNSGRPIADQGMVWASIADVAAEMGSASPTGAMHDIYRHKSASLADYERAFPAVEGAVGVAVAIGGRLAGLDAFDQPATARRLWSKLVRSYALDALRVTDGHAADPSVASEFLAQLADAKVEEYPSLGLGLDLRLESRAVEGSALAYQNVVVHLAAFVVESERPRTAVTHVARASVRRRRQQSAPY
jgi:hypothetical protein